MPNKEFHSVKPNFRPTGCDKLLLTHDSNADVQFCIIMEPDLVELRRQLNGFRYVSILV